jgi:hypothetical protein
MIELIEDFPPNVIAINATGNVTGHDYQEILVPLVEEKLAEFEKIRLLYYLGPDFKKFTTTALWDDAKIGLHHLSGFERVAVATDVQWIRKMIRAISLAVPKTVRLFSNDELGHAKLWIAE